MGIGTQLNARLVQTLANQKPAVTGCRITRSPASWHLERKVCSWFLSSNCLYLQVKKWKIWNLLSKKRKPLVLSSKSSKWSVQNTENRICVATRIDLAFVIHGFVSYEESSRMFSCYKFSANEGWQYCTEKWYFFNSWSY